MPEERRGMLVSHSEFDQALSLFFFFLFLSYTLYTHMYRGYISICTFDRRSFFRSFVSFSDISLRMYEWNQRQGYSRLLQQWWVSEKEQANPSDMCLSSQRHRITLPKLIRQHWITSFRSTLSRWPSNIVLKRVWVRTPSNRCLSSSWSMRIDTRTFSFLFF